MKTSFIQLRYNAKVILAAILAALISSPVFAANFLGADSVLQMVKEKSASTNAPTKLSEDKILRQDLKDFQKKLDALSPEEAATTWLTMVDRASKLSMNGQQSSGITLPVTANELMEALPPPKDWKALAQAIFARPAAKDDGVLREAGLRILAATLIGDKKARKKEIAELQSRAENADVQSAFLYRGLLEQISQAMLATMDDPEAVLKSLERQLAGNENGPGYLRIPNIVSLVGAEKSEKFLRQALLGKNTILNFEGVNDTSRLAQKLALEMISELKEPHWELINTLDSVKLYEAMEKRFGQEKSKKAMALPPGFENLPDLSIFSNDGLDGQKAHAQMYYLLGLIADQRAKEAVAVATDLGKQKDISLPSEALKAMERAGYIKALDEFFFELLSENPASPFWSDYVQLAAKAGKTERMLTLARATAARDDLSQTKKSAIGQTLFRALLAANKVEEGVEEMRRLIKQDSPSQSYRVETPGQLSLMLARIGMLLHKTDWINEGIEGAKKSLKNSPKTEPYYNSYEDITPALAEILMELDRGSEAEEILASASASAVKNMPAKNPYGWSEDGLARTCLISLARVYHKSGRPKDVIALLEKAPYWNAKDLADLRAGYFGFDMPSIKQVHNSASPLPIAYLAGDALAAVGRKDEARVIVNDLLNHQPGLDRAYELLISLGEKEAMRKLDELFALDQFEERPLIWKAELLRRNNKLEEAEKIARQAISIDPSDGEQGPNDRMRAYSVLADIREARGDKKEAEFFRSAVKAIRLSEKADKFYSAGLLKPAIKMYEDSLDLFADAYCIQSRLAIQLSELGLHDEAEAHYRRAYELMPDSFGRVESHCFGCERAFEGRQAQSLAEKVFTDFAKKTPNKPQVHYLLGYLRQEEERYAEALTNFQAAVRLDPKYLNAWNKLQELTQHVHLPNEERDRITFNILRLDPLARHVRADFEKVTDLEGLWNAVEAGEKKQPKPVTKLLKLDASEAVLEKKEEPQMSEQIYRTMYEQIYRNSGHSTPAGAVAQTMFVRVASEMFGNRAGGFGY